MFGRGKQTHDVLEQIFDSHFEEEMLITHPVTHSTQNDSHFTLEELFSTVLLLAERVYCHLKLLKTEAFEPTGAFSLQLHNYRYSAFV